MTSYVALLAIKPHRTCADTGALRPITGARSTWRLLRETVKPIYASISARAVGVRTLRSFTEGTARVLAASAPVPFPTPSKTASCRPAARTYTVITTLVARVARLKIVSVTSIALFTDPARRASSGTGTGS